jgi:hypothetical protein
MSAPKEESKQNNKAQMKAQKDMDMHVSNKFALPSLQAMRIRKHKAIRSGHILPHFVMQPGDIWQHKTFLQTFLVTKGNCVCCLVGPRFQVQGRCRPGVLSGVNVGRDPTTGQGLPQRAGTERARWVTRGVGFGRPCQGKRRESGRRRRTLFLVSVCVCACVSFCASRVGVAFAPLFSGKIHVLEET